MYNVIFVSVLQHSDSIFIDYTPFKVIIKCCLYSLSCILLHPCILFILYSSLYLLISFPYLASPPTPLPTGNH